MLKKSLLINLVLLMFFLPALSQAEDKEKNYSILNEIPEILKMFDQCSRMTPSFRTSYSKLDIELVEKIEAMLPAALSKYAPEKLINLNDYYRQYVSFGMLRREIVYVNAIHKETALKWAGTDLTRLELLKNWRNKTISICGGKDIHWGALYDGSGGVISEIIFNAALKKKD